MLSNWDHQQIIMASNLACCVDVRRVKEFGKIQDNPFHVNRPHSGQPHFAGWSRPTCLVGLKNFIFSCPSSPSASHFASKSHFGE